MAYTPFQQQSVGGMANRPLSRTSLSYKPANLVWDPQTMQMRPQQDPIGLDEMGNRSLNMEDTMASFSQLYPNESPEAIAALARKKAVQFAGVGQAPEPQPALPNKSPNQVFRTPGLTGGQETGSRTYGNSTIRPTKKQLREGANHITYPTTDV